MTKSRLSAKERRQQIIEKAAEVFALTGVEGTRTRDIAIACGINEALIYRHFASKEELYREAMVFAYADAVKTWFDVVLDSESGLQNIWSIIKAQLKSLSENPVLSANMWHGIAATTHDSELKQQAHENLAAYHNVIKSLIEKGIADGSIKSDIDPEVGTWFIRGITWTFILRVVLDLDIKDTPNEVDGFCKLLLTTFAADPNASICD